MDPAKAKDEDEKRLIESLERVAAGTASETEMRETMIELAVRDVLERDVRGRRTGYKAGTFAKALDAAMMTATSKEELTAFGKIAEFFRAISTMLKGVFGTVQALSDAKEAGTLAEGNDFELFVDQMLGLDEQIGFDGDLTGDVETLVAETYSLTSAPLRATSAIAKDKGIPSTITPEVAAEFKDRPIVIGMADLIAASTNVRGVDVHGGPGYPVEKFDPANPKKITAVWASQRIGVQTLLSNMDKTGAIWQDKDGHHWALFAPHTMKQTAHKSNAQTPLVYLAKVNKMANSGAISHDHIIEISSHIRSMVPGAVGMPDLGTVEAEAFFGSASFDTRANIMAELTTARSRDLGAPSPDSILTESRDPQYHGAMKDSITSLILIDVDRMATQNADGKWILRKDIGAANFDVDPHPSYDSVLTGRILAHFEHPMPFEIVAPLMVSTMKAASPVSRPAFLLTKMPPNAGIQFQPLTDEIVEKINEVQSIGAMFPDQKGATLPQIKMMVDAVNGNWTTFTQGAPTKGLTEFTNAIDRSPAKESLIPYTSKEVSDMVKDGTMTVHQLGDQDVWFGIKKGEGGAKELVSVVNNTGIPGTLNVIMAKALELGANKLDAYAVVVPGMPNGLLSTLYGRHGWKEDSRSKYNRKYLLEQIKEEDLEAFKDRMVEKYKQEKLKDEKPKAFRERVAEQYLEERFKKETPKAFKERLAQKEAALMMYWEEQGWAGLKLPDMVFMSHDGVTRGPELEDEHSASVFEGEVGSIRSASGEVDGTVRGGGIEEGGTDSDGGGTVGPVASSRGVLPRGADTILGSLASVTDTQLQAIGVTRAEFESFKTNSSSITSYSVSKKAARRNSLRVLLTRTALTNAAMTQESWRDWYEEHQETLNEFFAEDAELFQKILAITSQAASVKANVGLALKAYAELKQGIDFDARNRGEEKPGYLPAVIGNLNALRDETKVNGQKIGAYMAANEGDTESVVVDRHIARMLFGVDTPSKAQFAKATKILTAIAKDLGWTPRQVQAALWAASIVQSGKIPESYGNRIRTLHAKGTLRKRIGAVAPSSSAVHRDGGSRGADNGRSSAPTSRGGVETLLLGNCF
jgi:hypothetical protein